jgi:hypothetical protein
MNDFFEYLESKGVKDIRDLTAFVHNFSNIHPFFSIYLRLKEMEPLCIFQN